HYVVRHPARLACALSRSAAGGSLAASLSRGSRSHPRSRSAATRPWIASIPHFPVSGRICVSTLAVRIHRSAREGSGAESSFLSSPRTRSAESASRDRKGGGEG